MVAQRRQRPESVIILAIDSLNCAPPAVFHLVDDWGWANAGWHANPQNEKEVHTPRMEQLVKEGIEMDRAYSFQFCSPTRSSLQSGRYPMHVNDKNLDVTAYNPADPVSGFAAIPRNMCAAAQRCVARPAPGPPARRSSPTRYAAVRAGRASPPS
jgi:arylsulfatase I/J